MKITLLLLDTGSDEYILILITLTGRISGRQPFSKTIGIEIMKMHLLLIHEYGFMLIVQRFYIGII